jgi:hypothetical protein
MFYSVGEKVLKIEMATIESDSIGFFISLHIIYASGDGGIKWTVEQ